MVASLVVGLRVDARPIVFEQCFVFVHFAHQFLQIIDVVLDNLKGLGATLALPGAGGI